VCYFELMCYSSAGLAVTGINKDTAGLTAVLSATDRSQVPYSGANLEAMAGTVAVPTAPTTGKCGIAEAGNGKYVMTVNGVQSKTDVAGRAELRVTDTAGNFWTTGVVDTGAVVTVPDAQKVDVNTIKTNPVVNAGTVTMPANATIGTSTLTQTQVTGGAFNMTQWFGAKGGLPMLDVATGLIMQGFASGGVTFATVTNLTNLPTIPANWITAAGITAAAFNGKGDWSTLTQTQVSGYAGPVSPLGMVMNRQTVAVFLNADLQVWDDIVAGWVALGGATWANCRFLSVQEDNGVYSHQSPDLDAKWLYLGPSTAASFAALTLGIVPVAQPASAGDQMGLSDGAITSAKFATDAIAAAAIKADAVTKVQDGLSKPSTAQTITPPADMALASNQTTMAAAIAKMLTAFEQIGSTGIYRLTTAACLNVWAVSARTLSSFGSLAADVWAYAVGTPVVGSVLAYLVSWRTAYTDVRAAKLDQIGAATVTYGGPMGAGGTFTLYAGDDYAGTFKWDISNWTAATPSSASLRLCVETDYATDPTLVDLLTATCTPSLNGTTLTVAFSLTATQTAALPYATALRAQVIATTAGALQTIVDAKGICRRRA